MYLIKNITKNYEFKNIKSYNVDDQKNEIEKVQYANGTRKKIVTDYEDCIIKLKIAIEELPKLKEIIENLVDNDTYEYKARTGLYKRAKFIVTIPPVNYKNCMYSDEIEILLEKSANA